MTRPSLMDPSFKYTPAASTDIRVLFKRLAEQQKEAKAPANVTALKRRDAK